MTTILLPGPHDLFQLLLNDNRDILKQYAGSRCSYLESNPCESVLIRVRSSEFLVGELAGVGTGVVGHDLAFAVEFPFVDEQAALGFAIYEL
jgi:hypothetical protein